MPPGTLVPQPENAFPVANDDASHMIIAGVGEHLVDPVSVWVADEEARGLRQISLKRWQPSPTVGV